MTIKQTLATAAADLSSMIRTRVALFGLELSIETSRLLGLLALAGATALFGLLAVLVFSFFIVAFFWDTPHRMLAIGLLAGTYLFAAALSLVVLYRRIRKGAMPFQATIQELERDAQMFSRLKHRASSAHEEEHDATQKDGW